MDHPVLIVEAPELDNESVYKLTEFLYNFLAAIEWHYSHQLKAHAEERDQDIEDMIKNFSANQDPYSF